MAHSIQWFLCISTLVGKLFDVLFYQQPQAFTNVIFDEETGLFEVGSTWSVDDGNVELGQTLAGHYVSFMNGLLNQAQSNSNNAADIADTISLVFGHFETSVRNGAERNFTSLNAALNSRIIDSIQELDLVDGDLKVVSVVESIALDADFIDNIQHFGMFSFWKKFLWIKYKEVWETTEINADASDGATNAHLLNVVDQWGSSSDLDVREKLVQQLNSIYSDLNLVSLDDSVALQAILDRLSSQNFEQNLLIGVSQELHGQGSEGEPYLVTVYDRTVALDLLADVLYARAIVFQLVADGEVFTSFDEFRAALESSELTVTGEADLFSQLQYGLQIAAEYEEYLSNKQAYDSRYFGRRA